MAKRRAVGVFDPDYRTELWNESKWAPKNSATTMSQLAAWFSVLLIGGLFYFPLTRELMRNWGGVISLFLFFLLWVVFARLIRYAAWRKLQNKRSLNQGSEIDEDFNFDYSELTHSQRRIVDAAVARQLDATNMTPKDFEHEVAWLINTLTRYTASVVGKAGDGGIDVEVYDGPLIVGIVQCKRYDRTRPISPGHVRELFAVKHQAKVETAFLVTTARVTPMTQKEADRLGIKLIDGDKLESMREKARRLDSERSA